MAINIHRNLWFVKWLKNIFFISVLLSSCTIPRQFKYQNGKKKKAAFTRPFVFKNNIEVKGGNFTADEKINLVQRLLGQLDDSSKTTITDAFFFIHYIDNPPAYDSGYSAVSARNMKASMMHLGYYKSTVDFHADTSTYEKQKRVTVTYTVNVGVPTLIDTVSYQFTNPEMEQLALNTKSKSFLAKGNPISKDNVLNETGRLVELFRNNGYYKFTSDDIKVIGDTTAAILTNASDDPFESLALLEQAKDAKNKPTIKLTLITNPVSDTDRLKKYYVNNIYIYPDFQPTDTLNKTQFRDTVTQKNGYIIRYHKKLFRTGFLARNIYLKKGDVYNQDNYAKTINSFSNTGVWQSVLVQIDEKNKSTDSVGKVDIIIQLFPTKKYGFETNVEASYSSNSSVNTIGAVTTGDLLGLSVNASLQNRNVHKEAIKMTHAINAGVEFNLDELNTNQRINSNELGYTNTISFPRIIKPVKWFVSDKKKLISQESFINSSVSYVNRIQLFKMQNFGLAFGGKWVSAAHPNRTKILKLLNVEFSYLYDQTDSFRNTIDSFPYLNYSFNTALVMGEEFSYSSTFSKHPNRLRNFKANIEESGLIYGSVFGLFKNYMRKFVKADVDYTYTTTHRLSANVIHLFGGLGIPLSKSDTTLPFFEQYYGGGANSMRGWPIRGIGIGGQPLPPYDPTGNTFAIRTGDIKLEFNYEYRHDLFQLIPNSVAVKGALFADIGNIWDYKNNHTGPGYDTLQFQFSNLYKELGADIGAGLRFDFNYFLIRFDMGLRVKRPDITENDGWQFPDITFDNIFKRGVVVPDPANPGQTINDDRYRAWRYENLNFSIGINYPFQ